MAEIKDIIEDIYNRIDREAILRDLDPVNKNNYYSLTCPDCSKKTAFIYKDGVTIVCNRKNNCSYTKSLWDYFQEKNSYASNKETLEALAKLAGLELKSNENFNYEAFEKSKAKTSLLETALSFFNYLLWNDPEQKVLTYLKNRGYTEDEIEKMELGFYPSYQQTLKFLNKKGFENEQIFEVFKWLKTDSTHREEYKLVIPLRNGTGNLTALYGRLIKPTDSKDKYKPLSDAEKIKDSFFNIHKAKKEKRITIVEGYLDALIADARGFKGIVATGGSMLTGNQLESLETFKINQVVLALDNDHAGKEGTLKAVNFFATSHIKAFVTKEFEGCKDPDEFITKKGITAFNELIDNAISSSKWFANHLISKFNLSNDQEKSTFLETALEYDSKLIIDKVHEGQDFLTIISEKTGYDIDILIAKSEKIQEKRQKEQEIREYRRLLSDGNKLLEQNSIETLKELLTEKPKEIQSKITKPIELFYTKDRFLEDLQKTTDGLKTGYPSLDEYLTIPNGALTIVMGKSSHGKTTFLLNMLLKMVEKYQNKTFLFFSYEEEEKFLNVKLINILAEDVINKFNNFTSVLDYLRWRDRFKKREKVEAALEKINNYVSEKRLGLIYQSLDVDQLYDQLKLIKEQSDYEIGGVFIDYIQRIPIKGKFQQRQLELQAISNKILEASIDFSLPIILGAQVNKEVKGIPKDKDVRESGDILNNANVVLSIYNPAKEELGVKPDENDIVPFKVCLAKSRNTVSNNLEVELKLHGPTLKIFEKK